MPPPELLTGKSEDDVPNEACYADNCDVLVKNLAWAEIGGLADTVPVCCGFIIVHSHEDSAVVEDDEEE